jgi:hypothetical protein
LFLTVVVSICNQLRTLHQFSKLIFRLSQIRYYVFPAEASVNENHVSYIWRLMYSSQIYFGDESYKRQIFIVLPNRHIGIIAVVSYSLVYKKFSKYWILLYCKRFSIEILSLSMHILFKVFVDVKMCVVQYTLNW